MNRYCNIVNIAEMFRNEEALSGVYQNVVDALRLNQKKTYSNARTYPLNLSI